MMSKMVTQWLKHPRAIIRQCTVSIFTYLLGTNPAYFTPRAAVLLNIMKSAMEDGEMSVKIAGLQLASGLLEHVVQSKQDMQNLMFLHKEIDEV